MLVHELIFQGHPENLVFNGKQQITYRQLQENVELYRNFLYQHGVQPGDNIGLLSKNSPEFVYSYMAITSLGAVVVPLNFQLVAREIAYIVQDAKMKVLVTMDQVALATELVNYGYEQPVTQLIIPEFSPALGAMELTPAPVVGDMDEDDVCAIIYTSGTTGNPKGAMLSHRNLVSDAAAFTEKLPIAGNDQALCVLPMYHCFSWTCAVLGSLLNGAAIYILEAFNPRETISVIRDAAITIVYAVPAMYNFLAIQATPADFAGVKYFISGGASLPEKVAERFYEKANKTIVEGYGLSEASPVVCLNPLEKTKKCSIGQPLPGMEARVISDSGQDMPVGEVGELIVRGPNVMKGYFNLPEDTARALRDGWLYTGDLAYRDKEGYFFIVDRLKDMIIISGENIYPREIEELLYAHPTVSEAAVVGVPDKVRGQAACAYVVLKEGHSFDKKSLREYLQANLAAYKVPKEFKQLEALPKNGTGKILKRQLSEQALRKFQQENAG